MRVHDISKLVTKKGNSHCRADYTTQKKKATITINVQMHMFVSSLFVLCKINIKRVKFKICISSVSKLIHDFQPTHAVLNLFSDVEYSN